MRSSKNRSRSKGNRNRSVGNIVNRVFDSSGPEGKVRGTPQQIIDKYNQLARDAQLSNDRVAAENFQQHAEHYLRMLAEAQREQEARQQQQQQQQGGGQRERGEGSDRDNQQPQEAQQAQPDRGQSDRGQSDRGQPEKGQSDRGQPDRGQPDKAEAPRPEGQGSFDAVMDGGSDGESGLVATPEAAPKPKRSRSRRPKKTEEAPQGGTAEGDGASDGPKEAAE
jgi:hypothetical protein